MLGDVLVVGVRHVEGAAAEDWDYWSSYIVASSIIIQFHTHSVTGYSI